MKTSVSTCNNVNLTTELVIVDNLVIKHGHFLFLLTHSGGALLHLLWT